tara:strand:+ start:1120 stop:1602 length:483 start_codon:yes stop_codon:yes gene_type:complete
MKSYVKNFKSNSNITKVSYRRISNGIDNNMNIAIIGSPKYDSVRAVRDFLFNIKQKLGTDVNIITRGNKDGCEKWVRKYALEFGFRYTEYNSAHTNRNLYSGMTNDYYDKPYHPTQRLHQYDCIVKHSDKIIYFGGIKPTEQKYFEKLLGRFNKKVNYIN